MVNPALKAELTHQRVNKWKTSVPGFPAPEMRFGLRIVDVIGTRDKTISRGDSRRQMPGNETTVSIIVRLCEQIALRSLCAKIHVAEEKLACETCRGLGGFLAFLFVGRDCILNAPVEFSHTKATEMQVWA